MARGHWLVKSEPDTYSWDALVRDGSTRWDGVRNPQARNHLEAMGKGDLVLFYHSGGAREVVGVARVTRAHYADPTSDDARWLAVDLAPVRALKEPVPLARIKAEPALRGIALVRQARLSVMPLERDAFERILRMGATALPRRAA
jgi:predicted RNA-binding protein with PUA-like domain